MRRDDPLWSPFVSTFLTASLRIPKATSISAFVLLKKTRAYVMKFPKSAKYDFRRDLVKRHVLVPHLETFLGTEIEHLEFDYKPKEKDDAWHPSGHCTPPPTALYAYAVHEHTEPKEWGSAMLKTFLVGHFWHQVLQHACLKLGFATPEAIERRGGRDWGATIEYENCSMGCVGGHSENCTAWKVKGVRPQPWHWATGSADIAPLVIPAGEFLCDFKTMSSHQYKQNGLPDWAADKYEAQINIYMDWFDLEDGLIVAINKNGPHDMKEFRFARNQPLIDAIYDKWEFVSECITEGEVPTAQDDDFFNIDGLFQGPIAQ
jgi:hypothetical protein